ncbi:Tetratricopeptide-like helical [Penicillium griseofulvum]|uniref:Tetratricopeptide-like helical n=1 Tax=Penicillium patulum TaxID=5078 RepID=A0A135LHH6_PENPA|nr:Tetratricopeptide-like helical [Penicillium griseofulvum]KXG48434.1 Tetratricopeptide-like helical [Penicillium griseofulvum]
MLGVPTPASPDDGTPPLDYCHTKWAEAIAICEEKLNESERANLKSIQTFEDCKQNISMIRMPTAQPTEPTLLHKLAPIFSPLSSFVSLLTVCLSPIPREIGLIWGLAAGRTETLLPQTIEMLQELGHDLEIFQLYGEIWRSNPRVGDELMNVFVEIIMFWAHSIHFLNRNRRASSAQRSWHNVEKQFENTLKRIRKRTEQIKEKANAMAQVQGYSQADLLKELDRLGLLPSTATHAWLANGEPDIFPCNNLPVARNANFFGRRQELDTISKHLDYPTSTGSFRSFALYGTGGIGKTQIALAYAYQQKDSGTQAILWFNCETGQSLAQSFRDVASLLHLEGANDDETNEQNKILVLAWLRRTNRTWLCIFDNVEDLDLFRNAWPAADSGKALVTSRKDIVSIDPAAGGMEIEVFDNSSGRDLILQHVARNTYDESEIQAASQLATRLGGLALALVIMSSQIRLRKSSITAFVQLYEKYSNKLNKEVQGVKSYYNLSLATCWKTTFDYLTPPASRLLGIIAHLGPDALPEELFHPADSSRLPEGMEFCSDDWELSEALNELLSSSLIRKHPAENLLFVHRLIQEEFRNCLDADGRHDSFVAASILLNEAFPKLILGGRTTNSGRKAKENLIHFYRFLLHVAGKKMNRTSSTLLTISRYLMESGACLEEIQLMEVAMSLCEDKEGETYALLANSRGEMECQRAHCDEAYKYMTPSLAIMRRIYGDSHPEVGNGFNNYANIIIQDLKEGACEKAIDYYQKALDIFTLNGPEIYTKILHIPHINLAASYQVLQQYDKSIEHAEQSRKWAVAFLGEGCHFDGVADYHVGNSLFSQGRYDEAERHWLRALGVFNRENETHPTTNSTRMKLAMIKMKRGEFDEAILMLQKVLVITKLKQPSKGDNGEVARVQRKLAEALELKGDLLEATRLKVEAEAMRREIQGQRFHELPDSDLSYAMMNFHAFW